MCNIVLYWTAVYKKPEIWYVFPYVQKLTYSLPLSLSNCTPYYVIMDCNISRFKCRRRKNGIGKQPGIWCDLKGLHDDVIKWKHFPRYWPFARRIHRSPVNSPHKGQWHGTLMFSLIYAWKNGWINTRDAGDLRRHRSHYGVTVMYRWWIRWILDCHSYCMIDKNGHVFVFVLFCYFCKRMLCFRRRLSVVVFLPVSNIA